jgi:hypothetical protein
MPNALLASIICPRIGEKTDRQPDKQLLDLVSDAILAGHLQETV